MTIIGSTLEETSHHRVDERRSPLRDVQAAPQFPTSGRLRCPAWPTNLPVELINYHFRGA